MMLVLRALILTAATVAAWLFVVRLEEQTRRTGGTGGATGPETACTVSYVYDGDTVALTCGEREVTARLLGLDAPETRDARCAAENVAGKDATERLRALIAKGGVRYEKQGVDKYGRWLIRLSVGGVNVAETLILEELAVPYAGGARINWCQKLEAA